MNVVRASKFLAKYLRHDPAAIGLTLDSGGWVGVRELLAACKRAGMPMTRAELEQVVATNDKQRFVLDGDRIRASQGHSVSVDLGLPAVEPPALLYHGTVARFLPQIRREGLRPMRRHDVHLSPDEETARRVGARRGKPVVLVVRAGDMHGTGHEFRLSTNGVWLTQSVPAEFLGVPD
ncbi:RNA 2'-phosphotransferase [Tenggerimyces flavus]|uniref:Probable RNA 2'-phosphotransferase n=1 Tax=Tenggerimyces flavus TaxID=1708749 RepID=A0ABV7YBF3_9ACTN|nr:RNA 2'-phosphotransferase [Tenggerimyces flavus]MBM7787142.1 putative RNA 2'-phosphotransferase [Tenggerimyces flavus]